MPSMRPLFLLPALGGLYHLRAPGPQRGPPLRARYGVEATLLAFTPALQGETEEDVSERQRTARGLTCVTPGNRAKSLSVE